MTLEEIQEMAKEDMKIDRSDLTHESLKIPELHNKYLKIENLLMLQMKQLETEEKVLRRELFMYYKGYATSDDRLVKERGPQQLKIMSKDVDTFIEGDDEYVKLEMKIELARLKTKYVKSIIDDINRRSYQITNAIKFLEFTNGSN
jgi:hypothetical protein